MRLLVLPHARVHGWPKHSDAPHGQCPELGDALAREYATDAHHTAYAPDPIAPRRLTKEVLGVAPVAMQLVVFDVDDEAAHREHRPASDAWREVEAPKVAALLEAHPGAVVFDTRGGYRVVALLEAPVAIATADDIPRWSRFYLLQLGYLSRRFGIIADPACKDWQRLYRLPHATRDGGPSPERRRVLGDLRNPGVWRRPGAGDGDLAEVEEAADLAELERLAASSPKPWAVHARAAAPPTALPPRAAKPRATRTPSPVVAADLGALAPLALAVAGAIGELPRGCAVRHGARLAVAASLLERGWPRAAVERVLGDIARAMGKEAAAVVAETVGSTAERLELGAAVASDGWLRANAPAVVVALELHAPREGAAASVRRELDAVASPPEVSAEEGAAAVVEALERARADRSLVFVRVTAGAGKTFASAQHAADAAGRGERTVILAPTHAVVRDVVAELHTRGVNASHAMGPLSHRDDAGDPTCQLHKAATSAARAGQDVLKTMCDGVGYPAQGGRYRLAVVGAARNTPCPHKDGCPAYKAARASLTGDVVVTVHALAGRAVEWLRAGGGGLVVVDEAPALVASHGITAATASLAAVVLQGETFAGKERWRGELLEALARGLEAEGAEGCGTVRELLALGEPDAAVVDGWVHRSRYTADDDGSEKERTRWAPRVSARKLRWLHKGGMLSPEAADASRLAGAVAQALALQAPDREPSAVATRSTVAPMGYGPRPNALELRVALPAEELVALVAARDVGRVFLDATADPRLVERVLGEAPREVRVAVRDGAPVRRVFVPWSHGTRRGVLLPEVDGVRGIRWDAVRGPAREAIALALEGVPRGGRVALLTFRPLAQLLERVWNGAARDAGEVVDSEALEMLAPLVAHGVTFCTGYFGNLRGQNGWREADGLVVLGSPWPNKGASRSMARALGLEGAEEDVALHATRAELEQAVGRLRAPRRTSAAVVVVAATVPPLAADRRWEVRELRAGRPPAADHHQLAELAAVHGVHGAARIAGVDRATVRRARAAVAAVGGGETFPTEEREVLSVTGFAPPHRGSVDACSTPPAVPLCPASPPPSGAPPRATPFLGVPGTAHRAPPALLAPQRAEEVRHPSAGERWAAGGRR